MAAFTSEQLGGEIRSRILPGVNGLNMHVLEAGFENRESRPCLILLHGFPELAYSWRKIMPALAELGFYVIAPDQRGYGSTSGWAGDYDDDISPFSLCRMSGDIVALVAALELSTVDCVVGHDFGSPVAGTCAFLRPDIFKSVVLMSAPFSGPYPATVLGQPQTSMQEVLDQLEMLDRPRKHYQWYYAGRDANRDMLDCKEGLAVFLRNYFHHKSADWPGNRIHPLNALSATEMAKLPTYYVMDADTTMPEAVATAAPGDEHRDNCQWLSVEELELYCREYQRNGFQGGLQCYRCNTTGRNSSELALFNGLTLDVPALFLAGNCDWGVYQFPGALEAMATDFCTDLRGQTLIENAGHWVQQEQPAAVVTQIESFLATL